MANKINKTKSKNLVKQANTLMDQGNKLLQDASSAWIMRNAYVSMRNTAGRRGLRDLDSHFFHEGRKYANKSFSMHDKAHRKFNQANTYIKMAEYLGDNNAILKKKDINTSNIYDHPVASQPRRKTRRAPELSDSEIAQGFAKLGNK